MERTTSDLTFHGVVGGVIASGVVAVWFLAIDLGAGDAFGTPARLASAILGEEFQGTWPRLIVVFSILHVGVFAVLGGLSTNALRWLGIDPGLMVGVVFGIGVLNAVHYVSLLVTGNNLLTIVPVVHVTGANIVGGMLMMAYVHRATQAESPFGWNVFKGYPVLYRGIITGAVGAATVALWLFAVDIIRGIPFHTAAALGSAILLGATDASDVQINLGVMSAYTVLHLVAFMLVGITFSWLGSRASKASQIWLQGLVLIGILEGLFFGSVTIASGWVIEDVGWWVLVVANVLAIASMVWWLRRVGPVETGEKAGRREGTPVL